MKHSSQLRVVRLFVCALLSFVPAALFANGAIPSAGQGGVYWQVTGPNDGVSLRVIMPDGSAFEQKYASGQSPSFVSQRGVLPDGAYTWEMVLSPVVSPEERARAQAARAQGKPAVLPSGSVESGTFRVVGGVLKLPNANEVEAQGSARQSKGLTQSSPPAPATLFTDDVIVQGSVCTGLDCVNGENFGFDTLRLKENNVRIQFDDTSATAGFPTNNWQIRANSSASGGASFLGFVDQGATANSETGTILFSVAAGAPAESVHVASNGKVGFRTATPILDLHVNVTDTPGLRLEQNSSGGFTAQTWDIAGNEGSFFIRDLTGGSRLPFRIRPGAPSSSIDISATGDIGFGTASPQGKLHTLGAGTQLSIFQSSDNGAVQFRLQTNSTNRRFVALNTAGAQQSQLVFNDNGAFDFLGPTAADVRMSLRSNGNVGIGTAAPDQKLSVNGNASKPGGGSWLAFSDERLKNIKGAFSSGLDAVLQLQPIRYEYKTDNALGLKSEGEHIGFGAAALQKIIPEAVTRNAAGYLMVDNDPILWTMLNAIKEQNAQMQTQNEEIAQLKDQVKRLQAEVVLHAGRTAPPRKRAVAKASR